MPTAGSSPGARLLTPAKIRPPSLRDDLRHRPRLDAALDAGARIALVVAPAGYGKTVAVAHWAQTHPTSVAWLSIDGQDEVPARFWRHLAASIARVRPGLGDETLVAIDEWATNGFDAVNVLLEELGDDVDPLYLVLDDLHRIDGTDTIEQLSHFVERAPDGVRLVIVSRSMPALPVQRWRASQPVLVVDQTDLELHDDEARALVARVVTTPLEPAIEQQLLDITGGWPAALQLSCLAINSNRNPERFVRSGGGLSLDRTLSQYVVAEILDGLPVDVTEAVQALSVLDQVDARRAEMVAGVDDGDHFIDELLRLGLPLVLVEPDQLVYRFHDLFRTLVVQEVQRRHGGPSPDLLRRAAQAEEAAGDHAAAVRHLMEAGEYEHAFDLVIGPAWEQYRRGQFASVSVWLDQFPASFIGADPARIVRFAPLLALVGRLDDADRWSQAASTLASDSDDPDLLLDLALGHLLVALARGDTDLARAHCDVLRARVGDDHLHAESNVRVPTAMALVELSDEHIDAAAGWLRAASVLPTLPERARVVGQPIRHAWLAYERGELRTAEHIADEAAAAAGADGRGASHALAELLVLRACLAVERLELDAAEAWLERAVDLSAEVASPLHQFLAARVGLRVAEARSGPRTALADGLALLDTRLTPHIRARTELLVAELEAITEQPGSAERRIAALPDSPARRLVRARISLAHGGVTDLRALFGDVSAWPLRRQIEASLLRHRARPTERLSIQHALELGAERGFAWTYVREGERVRASLARQIAGDGRWRESAIGALLSDTTDAAPTAIVAARTIEVLSPKERAVLEHLPSHRSTIEIAQALYISANTVRTHVKAIYRKLDVSSRTEAVRQARTLGLLGAESR